MSNDLIWNYWVNNYLLGRKPPPFDILFWNADTTRMTAGLHRDFLELGAANALVCLLYTSPSPRDRQKSRMPSSA